MGLGWLMAGHETQLAMTPISIETRKGALTTRVALRAGVCLLSVYGTHQSEQEQWAAPRYSNGAVTLP